MHDTSSEKMSDQEIVVVKSGFASKCGGSVKSWKRRWFVLKSNGFLYYYAAADCKNEKGKIDVINANRAALWQEVTTADKLPSGVSSSNCFAIVSIGRTYTCACDSSEDARGWIDALNKIRGRNNQQYSAPSHQKAATPPVQHRPQTQLYEIPQPEDSQAPRRQTMPPQYDLPTPQPHAIQNAPPMPWAGQPHPYMPQPGPPAPYYPPQYPPPPHQQGYYRPPPPASYYPQAPPPRPSFEYPQQGMQQGAPPGGLYRPPLPPPQQSKYSVTVINI